MANDYHWRSTKAKKQLRDRFGRWISLGANVRWRADGKEQAGVVTSVVDGRAYVDQKNLDGTVTQKILEPSSIRVLASKATLPPDGSKIRDEKNNFADALNSDAFKKAMAENQEAVIERADGYALSASLEENKALGNENDVHDPAQEEAKKDGGNPILYQLYAPGGRSLGQYGEGAEGDFDAMVSEDKAGQEAETAPSGEGAGGPVVASGEEKPFRVPAAVKEEIQKTLDSHTELSAEDQEVAVRLAHDDTVSLSDVQWIHGYFKENELSELVRGGFKGRKWAEKIVTEPEAVTAAADEAPSKFHFDDDVFAYFAVGSDAGSSIVSKLLAVDYETGTVYAWTPDGFSIVEGVDITDVDEPQIIPVDEMTADEFAHVLDSGSTEFDILDTNPEERNLFSMAEAEIDFEELDRTYSIIAAAGDGVYTPVERSQNAKVQRRGAGGKFGEQPDEKAAVVPEAEPVLVQKATLPVELPLVENPAARVQEWLATATEAPVVAAGEPQYTLEDKQAEDAATGPTDEALYFAIVDSVDKTAVMEAIAIVKQNDQPSVFRRSTAQWVPDPDTLNSLMGATPPPVVELPDPETVQNVLEQIDAHDAGADQTEVSEAEAPQPGEVAVTATGWNVDPVAHLASKGYTMPDGRHLILDAKDITYHAELAGKDADVFTKAHIRKRARALNRMDLVPAEWREFTLAEIGELTASQTVYGEYGEIIVAAGIPGIADAPSDFKNVAKLQAYWTTGKGAAKIRWGTGGDLTRAHRHLSKYVGAQRAWGLAQKYHKSLFGVYNKTHDVATGQYVPRKRKK